MPEYGLSRVANMLMIRVMTMGETIRRARDEKGLTTLDLALRLGVGTSTVARLEGDDYSSLPKPELLEAISETLDIPISELIAAFGYHIGEESPPYDADTSRVARHVSDWTPKKKRLLWQFILAVESALDADDPPTDNGDDVRATGD